MMTHQPTDARPESTSLVRSVRTAALGLYLSYLEYQSRRALCALLRSLHDRTLKDLGIERDEIDVVVNSTVVRFHRRSVEGKEVPPENITARLASQEANAMAGSSL
jgi:uncharacterized protein YjiS (DUF1127 family)